MATSRLSIRVRPKLRQELKGLSSATGKREADIVREALEAYLDSNGGRESCLDVARRAGLIGTVDDAPPDLSTNPKHFGGFAR